MILKWNKILAYLYRVIPRFSPLISFLKFSPMRWSRVFCFFPSWSGDQITNSAYRNNLRMDRLHHEIAFVEIFGCSCSRETLSLTPVHVFSVRINAMPLQFLLEHRDSYPSRDEARPLHLHALPNVSRGHLIDDASRLCSLNHCIHWSLSAKILQSFKNSLKTLMCT